MRYFTRWNGPSTISPSARSAAPHGKHSNKSRYRPTPSLKKERPLFIPLKTPYFEAFEQGTKTEEYRIHGAGWNEHTCRIGRAVTLSCGYGRRRRLHGTITGFRVDHHPQAIPGWIECYGHRDAAAACIKISLK